MIASTLFAAALAVAAVPAHPWRAPLPPGPAVPAPLILRTSCGGFRLAPDGQVTRLPRHWLARHSGGTGRRYGADISIRRTHAGRFILLRHGRVIWRSHGLYFRTGDSIALGPHLFAFNAYRRGVFLTDLRAPERLIVRGRGLYPFDFTRRGELLVTMPGGWIAVIARNGTVMRRYRFRQRNGFTFDGRSETLYFVRLDGVLAAAQGAHLRRIRRLRGIDGAIGFARPGLLTFYGRRSVEIARLDGTLVAQAHWSRSPLDNFDSSLSVSPDGRSFAFRLSTARPGGRRGEAVVYVLHRGDSRARAIYRHHIGPSGCAVGATMTWSGRFLLYSSADGQRDVLDTRSGRRIDLAPLGRELARRLASERSTGEVISRASTRVGLRRLRAVGRPGRGVRSRARIAGFALLGVLSLSGCGGRAGDAGEGLTTAVPPLVGRACREAAAQVSIPVVCPRLVPRSRYVTYPGLWGAIVDSPRLWGITFNNGDNGPGYVHWMVGAGSAGDVRYYMLGDEQHVVRGLPRLTATRTAGGWTLFDYRFPAYPAGGPNGGHAATLVACGARFVFASVHGYARRRMAERMALDLAQRSRCPPEPPLPPARYRTMPAPADVTAACDRIGRASARQHARWRVVCPPLVPWSRAQRIHYAGGVLSTRGFRAGYFIDGWRPPDGSASPYGGHWTFAAGDPAVVHTSLELKDVLGRPQVTWTRQAASIGGQRVSIYRVDPTGMSELAGQLVIAWTWHGQAYQVSVHRLTDDRPALAQARQIAHGRDRLPAPLPHSDGATSRTSALNDTGAPTMS